MAAKTAARMRENSLRRKFDRYVRANPLDADLRRKAYSAVAAKLARIVYGLIRNGTDYRPSSKRRFRVDEPSRAESLGRAKATP
jgi:hypothetical protein